MTLLTRMRDASNAASLGGRNQSNVHLGLQAFKDYASVCDDSPHLLPGPLMFMGRHVFLDPGLGWGDVVAYPVIEEEQSDHPHA